MSATMSRVANHSVVVMRNNKRVKVKAGVAFDFTKEEVESLKPGVLREPINEAPQVSKKVANEFAKLVKAAEEAVAAADAKKDDTKLAAAAADAKAKVVEMAKATGLEVPESLSEDI